MHPGMLGAIVGGSLGLLGGVVGTYCSIKNTNGPRERRFVVKVTFWGWLGIGVFLAGLLLLPHPYRFLMWIPYGILLPLSIRIWNKKQMQIRQEEASARGIRP
jgi:hypothetical protein